MDGLTEGEMWVIDRGGNLIKPNSWDLAANNAAAEFENMIDQSAPPALFGETEFWTFDDWADWLMGR